MTIESPRRDPGGGFRFRGPRSCRYEVIHPVRQLRRPVCEAGRPDPTPLDVVRAHVGATFLDEDPDQTKAKGLMTGMLQSPEFMVATREWYLERLRGLDPATDRGRHARLTFLTTQGAFCLRYLRLVDMRSEDWASIFADIRSTHLRNGTARAN